MARKNPKSEIAQLSHQQLIMTLVQNPQHGLAGREFTQRYDHFIRHTISAAISHTHGNGRGLMREMVDDLVNEIYCRLFRNNCRALRHFNGRYENSIFAYLRRVCWNTVRNFARDSQKDALAQRHNEEHREEDFTEELIARLPANAETNATLSENDACVAHLLRARSASASANLSRNLLIFKLHFFYGYHYHEIARIKGLGLGKSGVANMASRLQQRLRRENSTHKELYARY